MTACGGGGGGDGVYGSVVKSSANGLVSTWFASHYQLEPKAGILKAQLGRCMATIPTSFSLTSNRVTTNY